MKNREIAGWLGILFGITGIHNFYLGKYIKGCLQLLCTIAAISLIALWGMNWAWWKLSIMIIWTVAEGCLLLLLPEKANKQLKKREFYEQTK